MACEFSIPFTGDANVMLQRARSAVMAQGGNFNGDTSSGAFDVSAFGNSIMGNYTVNGQNMIVNITSKPFFLPCSTIESFLKNQLTGSAG